MAEISLARLVDGLDEASVNGSVDMSVVGLACDSRHVTPGHLFVAIRGGQEEDRHKFVPDALARGARAVVMEEGLKTPGATRVIVPDCRAALAQLSATFYGHPDRSMIVVGVTGTNGKTTTALLVQRMLIEAGLPCGYIGTLGSMFGCHWQEGIHTTPEAPKVAALLRDMVDRGAQAVVMEASSHGLALHRLAGIRFQVAIFTNLSRDHLDFHGGEEEYFAAKARLFADLEDAQECRAIINLDDAAASRLRGCTAAPVLTYGTTTDAEVRLLDVCCSVNGMQLELDTPTGGLAISSRLTGRFNCHNIMAAVSCGVALGLESDQIAVGIAALECVPGRFEQVPTGLQVQVVVDYAHTPDALAHLLRAAREVAVGRLFCVFGCGGDRDRGKRPQMGSVAEKFADVVILTSDNPRSEAPESIIAQIAGGMIVPPFLCSVDRRAAIAGALQAALPGDLVVVAGKGHESGQEIGGQSQPFDDRQVVKGLASAILDSGTTMGIRKP